MVNGKLSRRRICDTCRDTSWDVGPTESKQMLLGLESVINYTRPNTQKR